MKIFGAVVAVAILIAGIALLAFLGWNFVSIIQATIEGARTLDPSIYVPLVVTVLTASLGLSVTLYTQWVARKREIESAHRERKLEIYLEFMQLLERIVVSAKDNWGVAPLPEIEVAKSLLSIRTKAVLWGSPRVLKGLSEMARVDKSQSDLFRNMDEIQRAVRADLGLSNWTLGSLFFVKILLTEPNEIDKVMK